MRAAAEKQSGRAAERRATEQQGVENKKKTAKLRLAVLSIFYLQNYDLEHEVAVFEYLNFFALLVNAYNRHISGSEHEI